MKEIIIDETKIGVIFLNSCFSEILGKAFIKNGIAEHIVCIRKNF